MSEMHTRGRYQHDEELTEEDGSVENDETVTEDEFEEQNEFEESDDSGGDPQSQEVTVFTLLLHALTEAHKGRRYRQGRTERDDEFLQRMTLNVRRDLTKDQWNNLDPDAQQWYIVNAERYQDWRDRNPHAIRIPSGVILPPDGFVSAYNPPTVQAPKQKTLPAKLGLPGERVGGPRGTRGGARGRNADALTNVVVAWMTKNYPTTLDAVRAMLRGRGVRVLPKGEKPTDPNREMTDSTLGIVYYSTMRAFNEAARQGINFMVPDRRETPHHAAD
jgi:hypothetical protein